MRDETRRRLERQLWLQKAKWAGAGIVALVGIAAGFSTDLYQITAIFDGPSHGQAALVVMVAAIVSGLLVKRDLDRSDLIEVLKTRE